MRRLIRVAMRAAVVVLVAGVSSASASAADWTQFRHDQFQTGVNPLETALTPSAVGGVRERWSVSLGQEILWASPLVVGDRTIVSAFPDTVAALDTATGHTQWSVHVPSLDNQVAEGDGRVYFATDGGPLYALNATTGAQLWKRYLGGSYASGPTIVDGVAYLPGGYRIWAVDASTGATRWSHWAGPSGNLSTPSVSDGIVVVGALDGVRAFRASTGQLVWRHLFDSEGAGGAIVDGSVYLAGGRTAIRIELATGRVIWRRTLQTGFAANSYTAVAGGLVFFHVESDAKDRITARSATTGKVAWSATYPHGAAYPVVDSSPSVAAGVVYMGFTDGHFRAYEAATGRLLKTWLLDGPVISSPSIANGQVEVGSMAGTLYAFSLPEGQ